MNYLIGPREFAAGIKGHVDGMRRPVEYLESMGADEGAARSAISAMLSLREPKKSCKSRRQAFKLGMADGIALGIRTALVALGNPEPDVPEGKVRCAVCGVLHDKPEISDEEREAAEQDAHERVIEVLKSQGFPIEGLEDNLRVLVRPVFVCGDCQKRLVAPLN